jgi:protein-S-isoprenylcysteine O-methyltransferase Ste14
MQTRLKPELNVSHVDEALPRPPLSLACKHYLASAALYGLLLLVLVLNPWFNVLVRASVGGLDARHLGFWLLGLHLSFDPFDALHLYYWVYGLYLVLGLPVFLLLRPRSLWVSKNLLIVGLAGRVVLALRERLAGRKPAAVAMTYKETHAVMFLLIKLFYGPLMVNSAFLELNRCWQLWPRLDWTSALGALDTGYIFFVSLIFLLDSTLFSVGYHTEARFLKNEIRYVETNPLHILVCIACYAPFNFVTLRLFGPSLYDPYILVLGDFRSAWTWALRAAAAFFLVLMVSCSASLFTRASNLTNRGIVTWGPYRFVRHPGYFAKNMFWLMTLIPLLVPDPARPGFAWGGFLVAGFCKLCGFAGWATLYYLRAITEERFLNRDPGYVEYCQRVKYRFIPGVW